MPLFLDSRGQHIRIGPKLGTGGEGAVYNVIGHPGFAAKIYHRSVAKERAEKIAAMPSLATPSLKSMTAWPTDLLFTEKGAAIGLLMPKLRGYKDIHKLYGPKSRKAEFPEADFRFLIHAAANIARAFATVHGVGCVIGDVNHGGVTVSEDATVKLIDCDSFQIKVGGKQFFCEVGIPTFTPPELQRRALRNIIRTVNHDNFALAILIFHLLFMGRHPFAGRFLGSGDMPIETAIQQHRFAYAANRSETRMEPPPNLPPLAALSASIASLFEQAFSKKSANGALRPSAADWISALDELNKGLVSCKSDRRHTYTAELKNCPWCQVEAAMGIVLFNPHLVAAVAGKGFNIAAVRAAIASISLLTPPPLSRVEDLPVPAPSVEALKERARRRSSRRKKWLVILPFAAVVLVAFAILPQLFYLWLIAGWLLYSALTEKTDPVPSAAFTQALQRAENHYQQTHQRYTDFTRSQLGTSGSFYQKKKLLEIQRDAWNAIPARRTAGLKALDVNRRAQQLDAFLSNFFLDHARIAGIGPGRKAVLTSYGIQTAADVERQRIMKVPGFGQAITKKLTDWRRKLERKFVFDPSKGTDPAAIRSLDQRLAKERIAIEKALIAGAAELQQIKRQLEHQFHFVRGETEHALNAFAQARANKAAAEG